MADRIWGPTLAIMARRPVAGAVKTRLAQRIGAMEALRFYRTVSDDLLRRVQQDKRWRTVLAVTPESALGAGHWPHAISTCFHQVLRSLWVRIFPTYARTTSRALLLCSAFTRQYSVARKTAAIGW